MENKENKSNVEMILVQKGTEGELLNYLKGKNEVLDLSYPGPEVQDVRLYSEFFESPFRMERRQCSFRGCFAINLTSYLKATESQRLEELAFYIETNPDAQYVLYATVGDLSLGRKLIQRMKDLTGCKKLCFRVKASDQEQGLFSNKNEFGY